MFTGRSYSGKNTFANELQSIINAKIVNMTSIASDIKKSMGTEEEPFEGEVDIKKV